MHAKQVLNPVHQAVVLGVESIDYEVRGALPGVFLLCRDNIYSKQLFFSIMSLLYSFARVIQYPVVAIYGN